MNIGVDALRGNLTNPARAYLWWVEFVSPVGGGDRESLSIRCRSTARPGRAVGRIHIPYKGTGGIEFPGKITFDHDWTCTFQEGTDRKVSQALYQWQQAIMNVRTGQGSLDGDIKTNVYLHLLDQNNNVTETIKLVGCFPRTVNEVALSNDEEGTVVITVTFSYDYWEVE